MSGHRKKKRLRSRSREDHRSKRRSDEKFYQLQKRMNNLTKVVETMVNVQKEQVSPIPSTKERPFDDKMIDDEENKKNNPDPEKIPDTGNKDEELPKDTPDQKTAKDSVLKVLGMDPNDCKFKEVKYHSELSNTWLKWKNEGLPEKNKKEILESYNRKGDFYTEAPKLNLEIVPLLSDIAKKRDQHFVDTQNCVGTAIAALGAAVSMLIDPPEEGLDEDVFTDYISHSGQILTDVFYQQSIARKSFITPQLNKGIKPIVDTMISKEWLYGDDLKEKVKDVKEIEKTCANIKDKAPQRHNIKFREQGNSKYPPAAYRRVGQQQRHRQMKFKPRSYKTPQSSSKTTSQTTNQSSSKK
ncbi:uncharacterized protein LOC143898431 [Temnothorax americanus]|uniref:uncharacterized protein LOC143898431 n=1 Tax=Temnothorax americanus TaxID=1964332 RepID=UPI0040692261